MKKTIRFVSRYMGTIRYKKRCMLIKNAPPAPYNGMCTLHRQRENNFRLIKIMSKRKANTSKRRPNFTGEEMEVLLQNVDVSILFHYGYIYAIEFSAYLFIYLFTAICSVRIVLLFILGHHNASVSESCL